MITHSSHTLPDSMGDYSDPKVSQAMHPTHSPSIYIPPQPSLHPYACSRCRHRKIKCDRIQIGCKNCIAVRAQCTYSARRVRKSIARPESIRRPILPVQEAEEPKDFDKVWHEARSDDEDGEEDLLIPREMRDSSFIDADSKQSGRGRLFVANGRSRYINREKANQVSNLEFVFASESSANNPTRPSPAANDCLSTSSLLGITTKHNLRSYHPSSDVMRSLWDYYVRNIDVLFKVFYKPAVEVLVQASAKSIDAIQPSDESLLLAICYATVAAMSAEECLQLHKAAKAPLLRRYRFALECALAQAGWMMTQDIVVLQALTLYIVFAPGKIARASWMMSGMALGIAQSMGMHSDSASFSLSPAEAEVRRRIWWLLCLLDNRISDDCGLENHIPMRMDTKLPLHVNDSDLDTNDETTIKPRQEFTEMTVSLVKIEAAKTNNKVKALRYDSSPTKVNEVEVLARDQIHRYEDTYMRYLNEQSRLHHLCRLGIRLIIVKLKKTTYDESPQHRAADAERAKENLIYFNADVLEITHQLPDKIDQLGWLFRCRSIKWHAIAYLLIEICKNVRGPSIDRAWGVLDVVFGDETEGDPVLKEKTARCLWEPLVKLLKRARQVRKCALQVGQNSENSSSTLDSGYETTSATPTQDFDLQSIHHKGLLGDPFLGSNMGIGDMGLEQLDTWVQDYQFRLFDQPEEMGFDTSDLTGGLFSWW